MGRTRFWIAGADGGNSPVRRWANLDACHRDTRRFGSRRHYAVAPWSQYMEIHWGDGCQLYITPVDDTEVCVVLISSDHRLRLEDALPRFPRCKLARCGDSAAPTNLQRGGVTASRRLKAVYRGNVALVGDASGSVDAITGEGLCLLFQQSVALAAALEAGDLGLYQAEHRRIGRRPEFLAGMMMLLDQRGRLRSRAIRALAERPQLFAGMLAMHVGKLSTTDFLSNGLALGWRILTL